MSGMAAKASAYRRQAEADFRAVERLASVRSEHSCQILTLCQHAAEKAVKSLCYALNFTPEREHRVDKYVSQIFAGPPVARNPVRRKEISRILDSCAKATLRELQELTPRGKQQDPDETRRNSEYPFLLEGEWVAPGDARVFPSEDIGPVVDQTRKLVINVSRFVRSLAIGPRDRRA